MGSEQSIANPCQIDPKQWIVVQENAEKRIVKSIITGQLGQQSLIILDPRANIEKQLKIYNFRNKNKDLGIVCVLGAELLEKDNKSLCGNSATMKVIVQHIVHLWPNLPQLTLPQCIYALNQSIVGFKVCFLQESLFYVLEKMIGINQQGHIKVWFNENFAENHPAFEKLNLKITTNIVTSNSSEQDIVQQIIEIIQDKCQQGRFPQDLKSALQTKKTFDAVHDQLQNYINKHKILFVDKIHPDLQKMYKLDQISVSRSSKVQSNKFPQHDVLPSREESQINANPIYDTGSHFKEYRYTYHPIYEQMKAQQNQRDNYVQSYQKQSYIEQKHPGTPIYATTPFNPNSNEFLQQNQQSIRRSEKPSQQLRQSKSNGTSVKRQDFQNNSKKLTNYPIIYETGFKGHYQTGTNNTQKLIYPERQTPQRKSGLNYFPAYDRRI